MNSRGPRNNGFAHELLEYVRELRKRVRRYQRYGILPASGSVLRLRAHRGSGQRCFLCGEPVLTNEPEIIIEHEAAGEPFAQSPVYRLHHLCHVIWVTESGPARHPAPDRATGQ